MKLYFLPFTYRCHCYNEGKKSSFCSVKHQSETEQKNIHMPRAGIEPALSGPQPDVLPLYYRGESRIRQISSHS